MSVIFLSNKEIGENNHFRSGTIQAIIAKQCCGPGCYLRRWRDSIYMSVRFPNCLRKQTIHVHAFVKTNALIGNALPCPSASMHDPFSGNHGGLPLRFPSKMSEINESHWKQNWNVIQCLSRNEVIFYRRQRNARIFFKIEECENLTRRNTVCISRT